MRPAHAAGQQAAEATVGRSLAQGLLVEWFVEIVRPPRPNCLAGRRTAEQSNQGRGFMNPFCDSFGTCPQRPGAYQCQLGLVVGDFGANPAPTRFEPSNTPQAPKEVKLRQNRRDSDLGPQHRASKVYGHAAQTDETPNLAF
jgi:hypothetical protein